jgi:hypothetical protein
VNPVWHPALEPGQWWAAPGDEEHRRIKILGVTDETVTYLDVYASGYFERGASSRIQTELDIDKGLLVLSEPPAWI